MGEFLRTSRSGSALAMVSLERQEARGEEER